jgi:predicted O-methyltransferase YrrM
MRSVAVRTRGGGRGPRRRVRPAAADADVARPIGLMIYAGKCCSTGNPAFSGNLTRGTTMPHPSGDQLAAQTTAAHAFITSLFTHLLMRAPRPAEIEHWLETLLRGTPEREVFDRFVRSPEFLEKHRVVPGHPPGHYYSPVVDPESVREYWKRSASLKAGELAGLPVDVERMIAFWQRNAECIRLAPFTEEPGGATRYYSSDGRYPKGDAIVLMCMIHTYRPTRIIEIGSGFSSAAMLDTMDLLGVAEFHLTCIDPYSSRLRSLLRPQDYQHVDIIERDVQTVPPETFEALEPNDILFIDSSHVLKTGSDVHFELFSILPVIKPGVLVHFHDIHFPFEYPAPWVFTKRWSWNEIYAIRAFLMYNDQFKIRFFTDFFLREHADLVRATIPGGKSVVGGSLWLERAPQVHG